MIRDDYIWIMMIYIYLFEANMDIVFTNRISARIFKECAEAIVDQRQYTDTPIELRKKITDCFDVYAEQHQIVMEGMKKGEISAGTQ